MLKVREVRCKSVLHRLDYGGSRGLTANFYKGCAHGCVYCYVPSLIHDEREWGMYVDVKVNAPFVLAGELRNLEPEMVFLSSATDPYQALEARFGITRKCLGLLAERGFPVTVLTRSPLVLRDVDFLKRLDWVRVGCSISTVSSRLFEPGVPPLERRLLTLERLSAARIETWVSMAPVVPGFDLQELDRLVARLKKIGVGYVAAGLLRFAGYAKSKEIFEATSGRKADQVLADGQKTIQVVRDLLRSYGLDREGLMRWEPGAGDPQQLTIEAADSRSSPRPAS